MQPTKKENFKKLLPVFILSVGIATIAFPLSASAQRSYTMVCRGGGGATGAYQFNANGGRLILNFQRANASATQTEPPAGQCAWLDRPISSQEPMQLIYSSNDFSSVSNLINDVQSGQKLFLQCYNNRQGAMICKPGL